MILLAAVIAFVSAWAVSEFLISKEYESTSAIMLSWPSEQLDLNSNGPQDALLSSNYIRIFNNLINSESLYESIIARLELDSAVNKLKKQIGVVVDFDTGIIKLSVKANDPVLAMEISQAFIECLREQSLKLSLGADIKTIDEPKASLSPILPNVSLNIVLAVIGGILGGILVAVSLDARERSDYETLGIQKLSGLRVLGSLPKLRERGCKNDPVIIFKENSIQSEAISLIRTKLQFLLDQSDKKAIIVTSPTQAEGKTTFAVNIAISLAQLKKSVLLIECNSHRPALNMVCNLMGYEKILQSSEQIQGSDYEIYRIPALDIDLISEQMNGITPRMNTFLNKVKEEYEYVILDCPPVSYSDTIMLSALIKDVVIVADYGKISYKELGKYDLCLNQIGANILGIVINNAPQAGTKATYQTQDIKPGELYRDTKKRMLDILISFFLLLVSAPLMLIISLLIIATSKGPVIFRHKRMGCGGKEFYLYKFAQQLGCNKIALAHHFDDVIETILMSMLYAGQIRTMMPKLHSTNFPGMELIRPMYLIKESDVLRWKKHHSLQFLQCACRFTEYCSADSASTSKRQEMKALVKRFREINPAIDMNIMNSVKNVNLETIIGYQDKDGSHSFLDDYRR
jgi:capsular polysaccharide biosynthesis protein/Mrp family chromosome partitioning ATPase